MLNANDIVHLYVGKCDSCILVKKKKKTRVCSVKHVVGHVCPT